MQISLISHACVTAGRSGVQLELPRHRHQAHQLHPGDPSTAPGCPWMNGCPTKGPRDLLYFAINSHDLPWLPNQNSFVSVSTIQSRLLWIDVWLPGEAHGADENSDGPLVAKQYIHVYTAQFENRKLRRYFWMPNSEILSTENLTHVQIFKLITDCLWLWWLFHIVS